MRQNEIDKLKSGFYARNGGWVRRKGVDMARSKLEGKVSSLDVYQFGICAGYSMLWLDQYIKEFKLNYNTFWGFDSFIGLPEETPGIPIEHSWVKGGYSFKDEFHCNDVNDALETTKEFFKQMNFFPSLVEGFYEDILNKELVEKLQLKPALYVDVDVDLYKSAKTVLNFMTEHSLLIPGTVLFYDDWYGVEELTGGESLAHFEWVKKFGVEGELNKLGEGVLFQITKI